MIKKNNHNKINKNKEIVGRGNTTPVFMSYDEFFYSEQFKEALKNAEISERSSK